MIHGAVNLLCHVVLLHAAPSFSSAPSILVTLLAVILSFALAGASWKYFEHPLLQRGHAFRYFPKPAGNAGAIPADAIEPASQSI